jgi:glycosyltransferase involved in cell wall biosynthesis
METSVIIPTCNKTPYLELTLTSLFHQSFDRSQYEVIVVDDGSTDDTAILAERFAKKEWHFQYIKQHNGGRSATRNAGIRAATGKIALLVDDDCICDNNLIAAHVACHGGSGNKAVIGLISEIFTHIPINRERCKQELQQMLYDRDLFALDHAEAEQILENALVTLPPLLGLISAEDIATNPDKITPLVLPKPDSDVRYLYYSFGRISASHHPCPWHFFCTCNISVDRNALLQVGLFDESFEGWGEEDAEMAYRLFRSGVQFDVAMDALNYHQMHPRNNKRMCHDWIRNYMRFCEKHDDLQIYLRWQVIKHVISLQEYEYMTKRIEDNLLSEAEAHAIKEHYNQFVADYLQTNQSLAEPPPGPDACK